MNNIATWFCRKRIADRVWLSLISAVHKGKKIWYNKEKAVSA